MGVYDEGLNERDNLDEVVEEDTIQVGISSTRCSSSSSGASKRGRGVVLRWKPWIRVSEIRIPLQIHEALPLIHFPPPLLFLLWMLKIAESKATHFTLAGKKSYTTRSCRRERKLERERDSEQTRLWKWLIFYSRQSNGSVEESWNDGFTPTGCFRNWWSSNLPIPLAMFKTLYEKLKK